MKQRTQERRRQQAHNKKVQGGDINLSHQTIQGKRNGKVKNQMLLYLWSICIAMGSLTMGYLFVIVSVLSSTLIYQPIIQGNSSSKQQLNMSVYISICTTALPLGGLVGSLIYRRVISKIQSQNTLMMICDILMIILIILQMTKLDVFYFSITRLLQGVVIGCSGIVIPTYLISISPTSMSGKIGSLNQILITIGIALGYAMGYRIDDKDLANQYNWRICISLPILMSIIRIIVCYYFRLDTIQRHITNRDWHILKDYISEFYQQNTFQISDLIRAKNMNNKQQYLKKNSQKQLKTLEVSGQNISQEKSLTNDQQIIFESAKSKQIRQRLSVVLCVINQFCGINAILFYSNQLFANLSHGDNQYAVKKSLQLGLFQIFITLLSGYFMDNFGRRTLMICGDMLIIFALLAGYFMLDISNSAGWDQYVMYAIFIHIGGFSLSLGPVTVVYISEILRDISPYMTLIWIETIFIALSSNILIQYIGIGKLFLLYALISIAGLSYVCKYMIESKGKSRSQIISAYERISQSKNDMISMLPDIAALGNGKYVKVRVSDVEASEANKNII